MSAATLTERPVQAGTEDGGVPAWRAVVRWSLRLFRREWRQQLLMLDLLTVAVAVTIWGAGVATNTPPPATATDRTAGLRPQLHVESQEPHRRAGRRPAARRPGRRTSGLRRAGELAYDEGAEDFLASAARTGSPALGCFPAGDIRCGS
jgi:hypothetical protein